MARNRGFVPDLGPLPNRLPLDTTVYVCDKQKECLDAPVLGRDFQEHDIQHCDTHGLPMATKVTLTVRRR